MNVTLRQLKVFETVASLKSYTRAAEALSLSQPAVSMQVKQLEDNIGLPLFEKMGKALYLTGAGEEMRQCAQVMMQTVSETRSRLDALKGVSGGHFKISVTTTASYFVTALLANFSEHYPDVTYSLDVTNKETLISQLKDNQPDLVIMGRPPEFLDVDAQAFMRNHLVAVAAPSHPLCHEQNIPLARFAEETIVVREHGSGTQKAIERFFKAHDLPFHAGMEFASNEAIKHAVISGLGLGILSEQTMDLELESERLKVLDVEDFPIERNWYLVHRKGKRLSPVASAFHDFVLREAVKSDS